MTRMIIWRVVQAIPLILLSTILIFVAVSLAGDPIDRYRQPNIPQATLDAKAHELGLDQPLPVRYLNWISGVLHGDFGLNNRGTSVAADLLDRGAVSFRLLLAAVLIAIVVAVAVGFFSAVLQGRLSEKLLIAVTVFLLTAPEFWTAVVLKQGAIWFNQVTGTNVLSTVGESSPGLANAPYGERLLDDVGHLILPTLVLVLAVFPVWALYQRAAMTEVLKSDYLTMARAKGLTRRRVLVVHGLRTALIPVVTVIAMQLPWIIGGVVVVETIFGWRGLGTMLVQAIKVQDVNTVLAFLLISAVLITLLNLAADIAYRFLDPRVSHD